MKPAQRKRIARAIRTLVPGLHEKGPLLAVIPRSRILRGVYLESSPANPNGVYVWAFVQPLFVPTATIVLSLGDRLGGGSKTWSVDEADEVALLVLHEGVPFFEPVSSPEALANWRFLDGRSDPYARESRAYSLVASGRVAEGARALREFARSLTGGTPWMIEMQKRAEQLANLAEEKPAKAHELLASWEAETVAALRIQDLP